MRVVVKASVTSAGPTTKREVSDLCFVQDELHDCVHELWTTLGRPCPNVHGMTNEMWEQFSVRPAPKPITFANLMRVAEALGLKVQLQSGRF